MPGTKQMNKVFKDMLGNNAEKEPIQKLKWLQIVLFFGPLELAPR